MSPDIYKLIWLFPIAFILHDFEEIIFFEPWLKKNAGGITDRIQGKVPAFIEKQVKTILNKSTAQFSFSVSLIFLLTCLASLLAAEYESYPFFLAASALFFLHGFMHIGQAMVMRRYVPAIITSVSVVIPYGLVLFWRLLAAGLVDVPALLVYSVVAIVLIVPFILVLHILGEYAYQRMVKILVG